MDEWRVDTLPNTEDLRKSEYYIVNGEDAICKCKKKHNAEHIVKCVNLHDKLVDALDDLLNLYKYAYRNMVEVEPHKTVLSQVKQLIQQAKGE